MGLDRNKCDSVGGEERATGVTNNTKGCMMATVRDRGSVFAWKDYLLARDKPASNDL
jgi:hypothetical protein